jgi:hypothetical protein
MDNTAKLWDVETGENVHTLLVPILPLCVFVASVELCMARIMFRDILQRSSASTLTRMGTKSLLGLLTIPLKLGM